MSYTWPYTFSLQKWRSYCLQIAPISLTLPFFFRQDPLIRKSRLAYLRSSQYELNHRIFYSVFPAHPSDFLTIFYCYLVTDHFIPLCAMKSPLTRSQILNYALISISKYVFQTQPKYLSLWNDIFAKTLAIPRFLLNFDQKVWSMTDEPPLRNFLIALAI